MIVRYTETQTLMDCEALAVELRRPVSTIRRHCKPVGTDQVTGRNLYDEAEARQRLSSVAARKPHARPTRRR